MMSLTNSAFVESHDSHVDTILTLPSRTSALAVAQSCRDTALVFMEDSLGWGKGQLAMWLMGPYGQITQYTHAVSGFRLALRGGRLRCRVVLHLEGLRVRSRGRRAPLARITARLG